MLRISEIAMPLSADLEDLKKIAAAKLKISPGEIKSFAIAKRSVDARKKRDIKIIYSVLVDAGRFEEKILSKISDKRVVKEKTEPYIVPQKPKPALPPVVVGFGPAGMFAALLLAQAGQCPLVLERGGTVSERACAVANIQKNGVLLENTNVQFGAGGAGTFSDGKLNTGTHDFRIKKVLQEFVACGAPPEILYEAKPHIGTDRLMGVVENIQNQIEALGGKVCYHSRVCDIQIKNGAVAGLYVEENGKSPYLLEAKQVIFAIGHSARDTFQMLYQNDFSMQAKAFSVGARIEHRQTWLNQAQYGEFANHPALSAADYKLSAHLLNGRSAYTFCMCPGGEVICASSEEGGIVTNGMSLYARDGENANSALLIGVTPDDFPGDGPLSGIEFQRRIEQKAYKLGGGRFTAPAQRVEDFLKRRKSTKFGEVTPSYLPGVTPSALDDCLPEMITESMRMGLLAMEQRLLGFAYSDAVLTGVETRSSSPVRILRGETLESYSVSGVYPCGEGAGYAGGIVSAAVDGLKCAEKILEKE